MRIRMLALLAALLLPLPLLADTYTYTYTGTDFSSFPNPTAYTTSDYVTITFTLSAPLPDSQTEDVITPLTWSFSDGLQSDNNTDPGATGTGFLVTTSSTGVIVDWVISDDFGLGESLLIGSGYYPSIGYNQDIGQISSTDFGKEQDDPGSWTETETLSPSPVPEGPSFVYLLLGGACFCGFALFRLRRYSGIGLAA